jgi:aerobic-type carbon monoxide dehydrogenase small subunit (CoxS/CutS family)
LRRWAKIPGHVKRLLRKLRGGVNRPRIYGTRRRKGGSLRSQHSQLLASFRQPRVTMATIKELRVNGARRRIDADGARSLLSVLRDDLDLTGSKYGCGEGRCGACTVLIDGRPARSCTTALSATAGKQVRTIEGLARGERLHPLQEAFLRADALQCGYCTSGMIMSALALLTENPRPSREEIVRFMGGNICRCGTYPRIVSAILEAARVMQGGGQ